jgi:hypothetical protein
MSSADHPHSPDAEPAEPIAPIGDEPAVTGDGAHSTVHRLGRRSITGGFDLPGEFDLPPEEPVTVVGPVPWELREAVEADDE